jgi:hypothetical protein
MTTDIKELVTYIRSVHEWCARTKSGGDWFAIDPDESPFKAADALEALAAHTDAVITRCKITEQAYLEMEAERDRLKDMLDYIDRDVAIGIGAVETVKRITAERDRLKAAITEALNNAQDRLDYDCKCKDCTGTLTTVEATLRSALGDAS